MVQPAISPDGKWILDGSNWILANCQFCKFELKTNWNYCPNCSLNIDQNSKTCTQCSKPINDDWLTCPYCTNNLTTKTNNYQSNSIPKNQNTSEINSDKNNTANIVLIVAILVVSVILFKGQGIFNISLYDWIGADCNAMAEGTDIDWNDDTWEVTERPTFDQSTYDNCQSKQSQAKLCLLLLGGLVIALGVRLLSSDDNNNGEKSKTHQERDLFGKPKSVNTELRQSDIDWKVEFDKICKNVKKKSPQYYDQERYSKLEQIIQTYHWGSATESDDRTDSFYTTAYHVNEILLLAPPRFQKAFENSQYYKKYQVVLSNPKALSLKQKSAYIVLIRQILKLSKW